MNWLSGLFVYLIIWWVVLFTVLPWGVRVPEEPEEGHASSAPENPRLWKKVLVTSVVSLLVWLLVYYIMESGIISVRPE
ncbi:DUF1467 family protein [Rhodospirillaceae bacterium SYSU D60014]|jgi:predicted secreted protein|uniref:DUF1467 family protein n=1 Tax=Virgifigura deserti TaxID=2268457 RepID=UPI000E65F6DF